MEVLVWTATLEGNLNVFLVLSEIWWSLLEVNHSAGVNEWVVWQLLRSTEGNALVGEESAGEVVTVVNVEDTLVEFDVNANVEVSPGVGVN